MIKIERYLKLQMLRENYEGAGVHLPDDTSLRHGGETRPGGFKGYQLKMAMAMTMTMKIFWTWNQRIYHYCKKNSGFGVTMTMTMTVLHRSYLFTPEVMDICANACEKHWVNASNSQLVCPSLKIFSSLKLFIIQCAQLIKEALDSR